MWAVEGFNEDTLDEGLRLTLDGQIAWRGFAHMEPFAVVQAAVELLQRLSAYRDAMFGELENESFAVLGRHMIVAVEPADRKSAGGAVSSGEFEEGPAVGKGLGVQFHRAREK